MISISAILRHICTPNVSPLVPVRTVVNKNVYEKTYDLHIKIRYIDQEAFRNTSTWSQIILAATLL